MNGVPGTTNITYNNTTQKYTILKQQDNKQIYGGSYPTLITALMKRDEYNAHHWNTEYIKQDRIKTKPPTTTRGQYYRKTGPKLPRYIYYNSQWGRFLIMKSKNKKLNNYGSYKTLQEAKKARDYYAEHDWKPRSTHKRSGPRLPKYITYNSKHKLFVIQKQVNNKLERFGTFRKLCDAVQERDLLIECNWDYELLCSQY